MESEGAQAEEAGRQAQATANRLFPVPPFYYKAFTDSAWKAHNANRSEDERASGEAGPSSSTAGQKTVAKETDSNSIPPWNPFTTGDREDLDSKSEIIFKPPRIDWIIEDGAWESFGQLNPVRRPPSCLPIQYRLLKSLPICRPLASCEADGRARAQSAAVSPNRCRM